MPGATTFEQSGPNAANPSSKMHGCGLEHAEAFLKLSAAAKRVKTENDVKAS